MSDKNSLPADFKQFGTLVYSTYPKIQSIYKRERQKPRRLIEGQFSLPEFEYLKDLEWEGREKVDGTNCRVIWLKRQLSIRGKTDRAQFHPKLIKKLEEIFPAALFEEHFPETDICLYGEGYGPKVQSGGKYKSTHDFVLFDVRIGSVWLRQDSVDDIAAQLGIQRVPLVFQGSLLDAVELVRTGMKSQWGDFIAEGLVLRPKFELHDRMNRRIITKVKHCDFIGTVK